VSVRIDSTVSRLQASIPATKRSPQFICVSAREPRLQVYPEPEGDRRHREEASTSTPRWLPTDLGNGITPGYRYEVEPSKVQPIRRVDIRLGLF
jgi:hypothetical protein